MSSRLSLWRTISLVCLSCTVGAIASPAQTFKTLVSFNGTDGANPVYGSLVQGFDGNFYGTTASGGAHGDGTVFRITPSGTLTTLHSFDGTDGINTFGDPVIQATNGKFYGTTEAGGAHGYGTVYEMTPAGVLTTLYSFCAKNNCVDGSYPRGLVQATNGSFYGATCCGGAHGNGTVFKIDGAGKLTTLYSFCAQANCADGADPFIPVQATDGNFYGTTYNGGTYGSGMFFKITPRGKLTALYSFCSQQSCTDGSGPFDSLVQASDGNFYGTTLYGGTNDDGTVFEITRGGTLTTLYRFDGADGANPAASTVQATNGNFYGTTTYGGAFGSGTVFEVAGPEKLTTLYSFCPQSGCTDGDHPFAGLFQATNGNLYGTTPDGGANGNYGTIFRVGVGLGPFVETLPTSGKVGAHIIILGNSLRGTTSVTFNGKAAAFKASSSEIRTNVPSGATTGFVQVTTPKKTLKSNMVFRVTK
ncbi:MAG: choice-of-anchor tandem repeat GloVer-containing protein [Terriglobales bacterium]